MYLRCMWQQYNIALHGCHALQRFDFGSNCDNRTMFEESCNQQRYGSMQPPEYDLSRVSGMAR
jgi:hypothetical protein